MAPVLCSMRSISRFPLPYLRARRFPASSSSRSIHTVFFSDEPTGPTVVSPIPGPKNKAAAADLQPVFDIRSLNMFADYSKSIGN